jgi:hypothetical protein
MTTIPRAIAHNRAQVARARELNSRAGRKVFEITDRATLAAWIKSQLGGAKNVTEVTDASVLMLPPLDPNLLAQMDRECPASLSVLETDFRVEYPQDAPPKITLRGHMIENDLWTKLPDEGVFLPGGRAVEVCLMIGIWNHHTDSSVPKLKEWMKAQRNRGAWDRWERQKIDDPDVTVDGVTLPEVQEAVYGQCVVTGDDLIAYGVLEYNIGRWQGEPHFNTEWHLNKAEAEGQREAAVSRFEAVRGLVVEKIILSKAEEKANATKSVLAALLSRDGFRKNVIRADRDQVNLRGYTKLQLPTDLESLHRWIQESTELAERVEAQLTAKVEVAKGKAPKKAAKKKAPDGPLGLAGLMSKFGSGA